MHNKPSSQVPGAHVRWSESGRFVPRVLVRPVQKILETTTASATIMLAGAVLAVLWANSPWGAGYEDFWGTKVSLGVGNFYTLSGLTLRDWVTDGAMAFFFFLVAMEVKRELVTGELRSFRVAALPIIGAFGGMAAPAIIYLAFNAGGPAEHGWGVPIATDVAFAVAVVAAVGPRIPSGVRIFLLSLAIVDDLGGIAVIAVFYTSDLSIAWLSIAAAIIIVAYLLQRIHVRSLLPYIVLALSCWFAMLQSGVHPTIAGVAFGFLAPAWPFYSLQHFSSDTHRIVEIVYHAFDDNVLTTDEYDTAQNALRDMRRLTVEAEAPLDRLENAMGPWVGFVIIPIFAFANAGVALPRDALTSWVRDPVALGIVMGLVVGKSLGIFGASWIAVKCGLAKLPVSATWRHMLGASICAGIGFTVALFIADLAFTDTLITESAKLGIFIGSALAGILGYTLLRTAPAINETHGK